MNSYGVDLMKIEFVVKFILITRPKKSQHSANLTIVGYVRGLLYLINFWFQGLLPCFVRHTLMNFKSRGHIPE